eukprot:5532045-Alexandrium_andersonii.AAC.1
MACRTGLAGGPAAGAEATERMVTALELAAVPELRAVDGASGSRKKTSRARPSGTSAQRAGNVLGEKR